MFALLVLVPLWPSSTIEAEEVATLRRHPEPGLDQLRPDLRWQALARDFVRWRIGSVVVGPMPNQAAMVAFLTDLLGREPQVVEGVYLWRDPVVELRDRGAR